MTKITDITSRYLRISTVKEVMVKRRENARMGLKLYIVIYFLIQHPDGILCIIIIQ
jgi:hypothetical protein